MVRIGLEVLAIAVGLGASGLGGLYAMQRRILFVPDTARPRVASVGVAGLQAVELHTEDGLSLLAWYLPAPPGAATVAYFHGNGGNLGDRALRIRQFAAAGLGVLMPEYRGYGGNPGAPSEKGFAKDATAAMAFLRAQGVPVERTVLYGESLGTGVAVRAAAGRTLAALILESPYTSVTGLAEARFPVLPVRWLLRDKFDSARRMAAVSAPVLVLQGARDAIVPPAEGRALFALAPEPKELWTAPDAGHFDLWRKGAAEIVFGFIRAHVPPE